MKWPVLQRLRELPRPAVLAHRGCYVKGEVPENTLPAFRRAAQLGADGFELDVRMTRDGELVVYHDASLIRFFNSSNKVRKLTWDELRRLNFSSALPTEHVSMPSLVEVLEQLENKYFCNIEVKKDRVDYNLLAGKLLQILRELDVTDLVWISSFDSKFLQSWVKRQSEIPAALLFDCFKPLSRRQIKKDWAEWLHPGVRLLEYYPKFRETGKPLCVWTVNRKEDLKICKELGVDAVITDNVPEALKVLSGDKEEIDEQS